MSGEVLPVVPKPAQIAGLRPGVSERGSTKVVCEELLHPAVQLRKLRRFPLRRRTAAHIVCTMSSWQNRGSKNHQNGDRYACTQSRSQDAALAPRSHGYIGLSSDTASGRHDQPEFGEQLRSCSRFLVMRVVKCTVFKKDLLRE